MTLEAPPKPLQTLSKPLVHLLVATIPSRKMLAEQLLFAVAKQTLIPDPVQLYLDRYEGQDAPKIPAALHVTEFRPGTSTGGPGGRWRVLAEHKAPAADNTILVNLDDDQMLGSPTIIATLVGLVETANAVIAFRGLAPSGAAGAFSTGSPLAVIASGVMACRINALAGLEETRAEIKTKCGFDPWGPLGDDDAALSFHFWRKGIEMRASGWLIGVTESPAAKIGSQFEQRRTASLKDGKHLFWQRREIAKAFNWPIKVV